MKAYIVSVGSGKAKEASHDIYKRLLSGVVEELQGLAKEFPKGTFKIPDEKGKYTVCELSEGLLKKLLKEDTVHVMFGQRNVPYFWANINSVEIS